MEWQDGKIDQRVAQGYMPLGPGDPQSMTVWDYGTRIRNQVKNHFLNGLTKLYKGCCFGPYLEDLKFEES